MFCPGLYFTRVEATNCGSVLRYHFWHFWFSACDDQPEFSGAVSRERYNVGGRLKAGSSRQKSDKGALLEAAANSPKLTA